MRVVYLILSILGVVLGIIIISGLVLNIAPTSPAGILERLIGLVLIAGCGYYIVRFFMTRGQAQGVRPLRGEQGVSTTSRVFLVLSVLGVVIGFSLIYFHFFVGYGFLAGIILIVIGGIYILSFLVRRPQTQKVRGLPEQTGTSQRQAPKINLWVQELRLYDSENRLKGVMRTDGKLYNENWHEVGSIYELSQDGCIIQNNSKSPVVFVKHDGRISSWNGSLGRVDPDNGMVYKHTRGGCQ